MLSSSTALGASPSHVLLSAQVQTRNIRCLPDVLVINCEVNSSKEAEFWRTQAEVGARAPPGHPWGPAWPGLGAAPAFGSVGPLLIALLWSQGMCWAVPAVALCSCLPVFRCQFAFQRALMKRGGFDIPKGKEIALGEW